MENEKKREKVRRGLLVHQAPQGLQDHKGHLEFLEYLESQVAMPWDPLGHLVPQGPKDHQDHRGPLALKDLQEAWIK